MVEETKVIDSIFLAAMLLAMMLIGYAVGSTRQKQPVSDPYEQVVDTLTIYDTITSYKPIYVDRQKVDSVLVPVADSVMVHDTLYVILERERVTWRDSLCEVYASGVMVNVDSVKHFTQYELVTIETKVPVKVKTRWGLGVQTGIGKGKDGLSPYVGLGVSYNLFSW